MIPMILNVPNVHAEPKIVAQENFSFQTSMLVNGRWTALSEVKKLKSSVGAFSIVMNIRRHLRSNKFSLTLDTFGGVPFGVSIKEVVINGHTISEYDLKLLKNFKTTNRVVFSPDNYLKGTKSDFKNFSSIIIKTKRDGFGNGKEETFRILMTSHEDMSNRIITTNNKPVQIKTVDSINYIIEGSNYDKYYFQKVFGYNHLIFTPILPHGRKFRKLYDVSTYNDPLVIPYEKNRAWKFGKYICNEMESFLRDDDHSRDVDFHGGDVGNLFLSKNKRMNVNFSNTQSPNVIYGNKKIGELSISGITHYDFSKKTTVWGPGEISCNGYIFPYSKKGMFIPSVKFSPNAIYTDLSISTKYLFDTKMLDKYEGDIKLELTNPENTSNLTKQKEFIFKEESFEKIILNELSLKGLEVL